MALTSEQVGANREQFIELIRSINRDFDKEKLITWLDRKSDFFVAPASTKYHNSFEGGLCDHSLNVYSSIKFLNTAFVNNPYDDDTLKIVALLHDISKANYFERYTRNVKDETGKWNEVKEYRVKDAEDRFIVGSDEQNAAYMIQQFIPLTVEETQAILHKSGGQAFDSTQENIPAIFERCPLAVILHVADVLACYLLERNG